MTKSTSDFAFTRQFHSYMPNILHNKMTFILIALFLNYLKCVNNYLNEKFTHQRIQKFDLFLN